MSEASGISRRGRAEMALVVGRGRRVVSVADAARALAVDRATAAKKLARWAERGWLRRIRRGLYLPVPVEAEHPATWSDDPLVLSDAVWSPCYFTGWTAANHWGLTEQVFQTVVLRTTRRVRRVRATLLEFEFWLGHVTPRDMGWGMANVWRDGWKVQVADPARTVVDLLDDPRLVGGIRLGAEILAAYLEEHEWQSLLAYGDRLGNSAVFKRLGYLVESMGLDAPDLLDGCRKRLTAGVSPLDLGVPAVGDRVSAWGIRANVAIGPKSAS